MFQFPLNTENTVKWNIIICSIALECPLDKSGCTTTGTGDVTETSGTGLLKMCLLLEVGVSLLVFRNQLCLLAKQKTCSTCSLLLPHSFLGAASPTPAWGKKQSWAVVPCKTHTLMFFLHHIKSVSMAICVISEFPRAEQIYSDM